MFFGIINKIGSLKIEIIKIYDTYCYNFNNLIRCFINKLYRIYDCRNDKDINLIKYSNVYNIKNNKSLDINNYINIDKFSILTYNSNFFLNRINKRKVTDMVLNFIKKDYSIICLQEVFDYKIRDHLTKSLSNDYNYIIDRAGRCRYIIGEDSGLYIASKYPIKNQIFIKFNNSAEYDKMANKGFISIEIEINGNIFLIINTHLQSQYSLTTHLTQLKQIKQINNYILKYKKNNKIDGTILLGDLNIDCYEQNILYKRMLKELGLNDIYKEINNNLGCTWNGNENTNNIPQHKVCKVEKRKKGLDYILSDIKFVKCEIDKMYHNNRYLSDHYGVQANF
jgi:endonuclease/exonuclease/phosphatase family metal-dependent hydrolase